jgi:hypothetical protein
MVLRHQVRVLERKLHGRVRYRPADRAILAALSRWLPRARCGPFSSLPIPWCAGTGTSPGAGDDNGEHNEDRGDHRCTTSSSS